MQPLFTFNKKTLINAVLVSAFAGTSAAHAAPSGEELDQRIKILERQLEIQQEEAAAKAKDATTASASEKGFSLKKGDFELKINALAQIDGRFYLDDGPTASQPAAPSFSDGFRARRLRPTLQGTLGKLVAFRFTPEFAGDGTGLASSIVDAYFDLKFDPAASLRIGKQKGPVGLERLQSGGSITFIERGYPTELVPNRDVGVALYGDLFNSTVNYTVGLFNGTRDGRDIDGADSDNRHEVAGRLFTEPFKNSPGALQGLGFGVGGSTGTRITRNGATITNPAQYRTPGQNTFFQYAGTVFANGTQTRISPQAYWYFNSLGLLAEYVTSEQELTNSVTTGTPAVTTVTEGKFTNKAYEVTVSYVLTGEDASYKGVVKPKNSYTVGGKGWGAFEVAARYGQLDIDDDTFTEGFANANTAASKATSYGIGVNWYLTPNAKLVLDYDTSKFDGGGASGQDRLDEKTLFTRLQITY